MRTFPLQLKPASPALQTTASAWFLPAADSQTWLNEAILTGIDPAELRLFIIPTSSLDLTPAGALLTSKLRFAAGKTCAAIPCATLGTKLYYPQGAKLSPPVTPAELERSLPSDQYFLHPTLGLTGFDASDGLSLLDLLAPPAEQASDWSQAHPGIPPVPRLTSVELTLSESLEDLLGPGRDDIGSEDKKDLPKHPDEKGKGSGKAGLLGTAGAAIAGAPILAAGGLLKGILKATKGVPTTADRRTWINFLQDWAQQRLDNINYLPKQEKEIERLLHLLETNPDEGLKFALPLSADDARGMQGPSSELARHNTDFSLRNLGGGAYSAWDIDWHARQRLTEKYREAANREIRLGRHRRAAYIFAELLGDRSAAADALKQGKHYREAAILYRDHLSRALEAADCFRRAGMIHDAVTIYEKEKKFELLGDLYRELDREPEAILAFRQEVARLLDESRQPLPAAALLETKLKAPEEALALLHDSWPASNSAAECLRDEFALLERLARPEAADARIAEVANDTPRNRVMHLVPILGEIARTYFNPNTRELARDAAKVVTGKNLKGLATSEQKRLLSSIQQTEAQDLLLLRDTRRFTEFKPSAQPARKPPRPNRPASDSVILVKQTPLSKDVRWIAATAWNSGFYIAGFTENELVLRKIRWNQNSIETASWPFFPATIGRIHLVPENPSSKICVYNGDSFLDPTVFNTGDSTSSTTQNSRALGYAPGPPNWTIEFANDELALYARTPLARGILATHSLSLLPPGIDKLRLTRELGFIPMLCQKEQVIFAIQNHVGRLFRDKIEWVELPQPVVAIHASQPHTKLRIVATFKQGAAVLWADSEWGTVEFIAPDLSNPVAGFTRSGKLVVATTGSAKTYLLVGQNAVPQHDFRLDDDANPIGIVDRDLKSFHIITANQQLHYRFEK